MKLSRGRSHTQELFLEARRSSPQDSGENNESGEKVRGEKWRVKGRQHEGTLQWSMSVNVAPAASEPEDLDLIRGDGGNHPKNA